MTQDPKGQQRRPSTRQLALVATSVVVLLVAALGLLTSRDRGSPANSSTDADSSGISTPTSHADEGSVTPEKTNGEAVPGHTPSAFGIEWVLAASDSIEPEDPKSLPCQDSRIFDGVRDVDFYRFTTENAWLSLVVLQDASDTLLFRTQREVFGACSGSYGQAAVASDFSWYAADVHSVTAGAVIELEPQSAVVVAELRIQCGGTEACEGLPLLEFDFGSEVSSLFD